MQTRDDSRKPAACRGAARFSVAGLAVGCAAVLGGCAAYGPPAQVVGLSLPQVEQTMGRATGRYTLPDGTVRVEFARGPMGRHTWMMDLDAQGRVLRSEQVLTEAIFRSIQDGDSPAAVLQRIGRPSQVRQGGWAGGEVWNWRYDDTNLCQWFEMSVIAGAVRQPSLAPDPRCDVNSKEARD